MLDAFVVSQFCSVIDKRKCFATPWIEDGLVIASQGAILLAIPCGNDVEAAAKRYGAKSFDNSRPRNSTKLIADARERAKRTQLIDFDRVSLGAFCCTHHITAPNRAPFEDELVESMVSVETSDELKIEVTLTPEARDAIRSARNFSYHVISHGALRIGRAHFALPLIGRLRYLRNVRIAVAPGSDNELPVLFEADDCFGILSPVTSDVFIGDNEPNWKWTPDPVVEHVSHGEWERLNTTKLTF